MDKANYIVEDDGDQLQVSFILEGRQVAGACVPMDLGDDAAYSIATMLGEAFVAGGVWGGVRPI